MHAARLIREIIVLKIACSAEGSLTGTGYRADLEKAFKLAQSTLPQVVVSQVGIARVGVMELCCKSRLEFEQQAPNYFEI